MKIKNEKQQLREKSAELNSLIEWQRFRVKKARRRYRIKKDWITSFWIGSDADLLKFELTKEEDIENSLVEYNDIIGDRLLMNKLNQEHER